MLQDGLIELSTSPFSSLVLLIKKKDGSSCFCIDYRALNALTVKDAFPILMVEELLNKLHGSTLFSKLDLRSSYHQVLVHPEDKHKTAFRTHHSHFQWVVMPIWLFNPLAKFQALMNTIFQGVFGKFVLVFFDDILIYSASWELHLHHLEVVLTMLTEHKLFTKLSKCIFSMQEVEYLGHVVSS